jgi:hypothetical protein
MKKLINSLVKDLDDKELFEALICVRKEIDRRHGYEKIHDNTNMPKKSHTYDTGWVIFNP